MNTKCLITVSIFALISASTVQAADVVMSHQPLTSSAPSNFVVPTFTWTGFYIGGQTSGFSSKTDMSIVGEQQSVPLSKDLSPKLSGFEGGLYAGSNIDLGDNFVLGIDTDFTWSGKKHTKNIIIGAPDDTTVDALVARSRRSVRSASGNAATSTLSLTGSGIETSPTTPTTAAPAPAKPVQSMGATSGGVPGVASRRSGAADPAVSAKAPASTPASSAAKAPLTLARSLTQESAVASGAHPTSGARGASGSGASGSSAQGSAARGVHSQGATSRGVQRGSSGHPHGTASYPHAMGNSPHGSHSHGVNSRDAQRAVGHRTRGTQEAAENGSNVYGIEEMGMLASALGLENEGAVETLSHIFKQNWVGATRIRIGFAADRFMPYVAGGIAYGQFHDTVSISVKREDGGVIVSKNLSDETKTMVGYTLGGGVDFAMLDNVILRAEYRYSDFGKKKFVEERLEIKYKTNDFRVGVAYKF
ncbi:outer membrane protein [Bartonella acomydis]|uniref:Outer membrane protein beta-barrel domain-containing protein n=1 Tax=Bartonella acomydis TaxID=686234 RepID=A0ABP9MPC8_9HYPH